MPRIPKISCLTVTRDRPEMLRRAIALFSKQTWPNKELIIVADGRGRDRAWLAEYAKSLGPGIVVSFPGPGYPLGWLRNRTVELATGAILCTWDDDNVYHPGRLAAQAKDLLDRGAHASYIRDYIQFFADTKTIYLCRWRTGPGIPGSQMCLRTRVRYPDHLERREDSAYQAALLRTGKVVSLENQPHLYFRVYHGGNTMSRAHHENLIRETAVPGGDPAGPLALLTQAVGKTVFSESST